MKKLPQEATRAGQLFPRPHEGELLFETPPTFTWRQVAGVKEYRLEVERADGLSIWQGTTRRSFAVPEIVLPAGAKYRWNLYAGDMARGWQGFEIASEAVTFVRPKADDVFDQVPACRPRHLFFRADIAPLRAARAAQLETLARNIRLAYEDGMPVPPAFHRDADALPYREYMGRHRDFVDRNLIACALGHALLNDARAAAHAKELLLTICDWSSEGPCSLEGPWGDEVGLSHARCLPAAFDLIWDVLDERQRLHVARTIRAYALQCERMLARIDFCANPGNSHAGRLPAYLGEAAMVLKGIEADEGMLRRWLALALEIYGGFFPYFGGQDGGWAEGTFYATSYTKWYLPFFLAVERYAGVRLLDRPFYQRFPLFLQHFCPPGWENHPFGDGYWCNSDDPEWPGFFAQNPYHIYAERAGSALVRAWSRQQAAPALFKLHLLDVFLPEGRPVSRPLAAQTTRAQAFEDTGYLSLHTDPEQPALDIALLARASRFGSDSHRHADQGSFALIARGVALISPSGYFGRAYGTKHHLEWTNTTAAHNSILVDGAGQPTFSHLPVGRVLGCADEGERLVGSIDPAAAYPMLTHWVRSFELTRERLTVRDRIEAGREVAITWLLHTLSRPRACANGFELVRGGLHLAVRPTRGLGAPPTISDRFGVDLNEGVPAAYRVSAPAQYHISWTTEARRVHEIEVVFDISPVAQ